MLDNFFEDKKPVDLEQVSTERAQNIKAAVMERIAHESEENKMKKRTFIRPLLVAAAAVSVSAVSLVTANAATNGAVVDGVTKIFTVFINGEPADIEAKYTAYDVDGTHIEQYELEIPGGDESEDVAISYIYNGDDLDGVDFESFDSGDIIQISKEDIDVSSLPDEVVAEFSDSEITYWTDAEDSDSVQYDNAEITIFDYSEDVVEDTESVV